MGDGEGGCELAADLVVSWNSTFNVSCFKGTVFWLDDSVQLCSSRVCLRRKASDGKGNEVCHRTGKRGSGGCKGRAVSSKRNVPMQYLARGVASREDAAIVGKDAA